jgi:hypothetical protein
LVCGLGAVRDASGERCEQQHGHSESQRRAWHERTSPETIVVARQARAATTSRRTECHQYTAYINTPGAHT